MHVDVSASALIGLNSNVHMATPLRYDLLFISKSFIKSNEPRALALRIYPDVAEFLHYRFSLRSAVDLALTSSYA